MHLRQHLKQHLKQTKPKINKNIFKISQIYFLKRVFARFFMLKKKNFFTSSKDFGALDYIISTSIFALLLISIFLFCALLLGFLFFKLPEPLKTSNFATLGSLYIAVLSSSFIISKKNRQKYFLCAVFNAFFLFTILFILSLIGKSGILNINFLLRIISLPLCFFGAFLGMHREKPKKHKHR